jgi:hypothetical protein
MAHVPDVMDHEALTLDSQQQAWGATCPRWSATGNRHFLFFGAESDQMTKTFFPGAVDNGCWVMKHIYTYHTYTYPLSVASGHQQ